MTLLDHGQPADTPTRKHRRTGLIAVLAVLAVALLAAGAWLIVDRQQQPLSAEQRQHAAIMEVVTAHIDAINAGDADALQATLTDDFTWNQDGWMADADTYGVATMGNGRQETFTGDDAVFSGDLRVTIPTHSDLVGDGTHTFTLREVDGQLKIAHIVSVVDSQQQPSPTKQQQAAIMDVVRAHRDALYAGDRDAILATLTDDASALYGQVVMSRDGYVGIADGDALYFLEDPVFFCDPPQVSIPTRAEYPRWTVNGAPAEPKVGTYIFTLREVDGQLKIATIVMNVS